MATKYNLVIDQGATFSVTLSLTDENGDVMDLNGLVGTAQLRKTYSSVNAVSFTTAISPNSGEITISLSANTTSDLEDGRYVYDVEVREISTGTVSRIIEGLATVTPNVTR